MSAFLNETVTHVHRWTDSQFSFRTTRDPGFRFENGQFTMIGLPINGKPLLRAYSIVSTKYDEYLEFLSIIVPTGALTSTLSKIGVGDSILVGRKPTGTLLLDNLKPGKNLYLLSTGTGLAPFLSVVRDFETYERFEKVILVHGCRTVAELAYHDYLTGELLQDEVVGGMVKNQLIYYPTVTREEFRTKGRITDLMTSGKIYQDIGLPPLNAETDRVMMCGSPDMLRDCRTILEEAGLKEGSQHEEGEYVLEKAFVG
ncbi:ferredoxin--NADP(+) reductase [Agaricicola taiwanensis]|uniref:ferredoxin--NADP(+) reductase n=1 Tax=Agaricicola taiwanensis TaxID=591372 RepID=A0A8J2YN17_9RHOB|nr:ferredoxin--NADP reductase [Agaricicola taiwanensis]GGE54288.1 ferredoxin--NADP(+) reductase [Agaricicola taiwanensis]